MNDSASKFVAKILLAAFTVSSLQLVPPSAHAAAPSSISLVATGISGEVTLTWGEPTGDPPVAYEYSIWSLGNVQVGVTGNLDASAPRSATIGGLTNGQSYSAKVSTIYAIPDSTGTLQSDSVIPYSVPNPPQKPIAERTGPGSVSISWVDESENGRAVSSYSVTCIPQCSTPISGAVSPMSISGLDTSTDYRFKVSAVNVAGPSLLSSASDPIRPSDVPGIPEIASVAAYDSSILVNWSAPATDGGSEVVEYLVTSYPESKTCKTSSATEFSCTVA